MQSSSAWLLCDQDLQPFTCIHTRSGCFGFWIFPKDTSTCKFQGAEPRPSNKCTTALFIGCSPPVFPLMRHKRCCFVTFVICAPVSLRLAMLTCWLFHFNGHKRKSLQNIYNSLPHISCAAITDNVLQSRIPTNISTELCLILSQRLKI